MLIFLTIVERLSKFPPGQQPLALAWSVAIGLPYFLHRTKAASNFGMSQVVG